MGERFSLEKGVMIAVPVNAVKQDCVSDDFNPETPKIFRLREFKRKKGSLFSVKLLEDGSRSREAVDYSGKVLFVPANTQAGDELKIEWVDETCACAVFAS